MNNIKPSSPVLKREFSIVGIKVQCHGIVKPVGSMGGPITRWCQTLKYKRGRRGKAVLKYSSKHVFGKMMWLHQNQWWIIMIGNGDSDGSGVEQVSGGKEDSGVEY